MPRNATNTIENSAFELVAAVGFRWPSRPAADKRMGCARGGAGRHRRMSTYVIGADCIDVLDATCVEVCPINGCIAFERGVDRKLFIDPDACIDCGACEPVCPVEAIFREDDLPEEEEEFLEIDALWFEDRAAARARVDAIRPPRGDVR